MTDSYRLKIKIGDHEFEAEGPAADVRAQFEAFRDLVVGMPRSTAPQPQAAPQPVNDVPVPPTARQDAPPSEDQLAKIMKVDSRVVSLTVRADTPDDAVLLLLYGQKALRDNDSVTGGEIIEGLKATGGTSIGRVDRVLEKMGRDGDVIVIGERRGKRYRLTNAGLSRGRQIAAALLATVP